MALIGVDRRLDQTGLTLADHAGARQGSGLGYAGGQRLSGIDTDLQHGQDGYSVWGSANSALGPGSSGGPLLDESGQIIGVNSAGTPGSATWWADIGPFLPQLTQQMQANDGVLQATGPFQTGPVQVTVGTTLPDLPAAGQETVAPQLPNAVTVGGENRVNNGTTGSQSYSAIAALKDGGYVVAWVSGSDIDAQRFTSNGMNAGGPVRINDYSDSAHPPPAPNSGSSPSITALADGGYVVTWQSSRQDSSDIYALRFASTGSPVGGEFRVNSYATNDQSQPDITTLSDGGYVVTWASYGQDGSSNGVYAQRYASNGSAVGGEFRVNSNTQDWQGDPAISAQADGGYVVTWDSYSQDGSGSGISAQRYASNGSALGGEFRVNSTTTGDQWYSAINTLADGSYVVVWQGNGSSGYGIYAQHYTSTGSTTGGEIHVNTSTASYIEPPEIAATNDGGYVVTWALGSKSGGVYNHEIMAQRFASTGGPIGSEFRVNSTTTADQVKVDPAVKTEKHRV